MVLRILLFTLLWVSALASPLHDTTIRSIEKRGTPGIDHGAFSPNKQEQIHDAFKDALTLASYARHALNQDSMNTVYLKYFRQKDKNTVKEVFNNILGGPTSDRGSSLLRSITIVKDYKDPETGRYHCTRRSRQAVFDDTSPPEMIICPVAFTYAGGIDKAYRNVAAVTCDTVGYAVSKRMNTMGSTILHEYTHFTRLVVPPLAAATEDYENKLHQLKIIARTRDAVNNAESYAQFANEAFWTLKCGRWFDEADPYAESSGEDC